jgi:mannose-1-phosphate guanylyltransferase
MEAALHYYALIMAGGSGTRLWPLSRQTRPKQALRLVGERTMFQLAVERLAPLFPQERVYTITAAEQVGVLLRQVPTLPGGNFIVEPLPRGTASAVGLAAIMLRKIDPEATMAVLTADHYIADTDAFRKTLAAAYDVAQQGHLVTLGIMPKFASTGFGYIERGDPLGEFDGRPAYHVQAFREKPDQATAETFLASGKHTWNSGMFIWRVDCILAEFEKQMPRFYTQLMRIDQVLGTDREQSVLAYEWPRVATQTIDYGIMENAENVAVIPADIGWSDIGSWATLLEILPGNQNGNVVIDSELLDVDTQHTLVYGNDRLVATIGLSDLVIVDTDDVLLICPRNRSQDVRKLVDKLRASGKEKYL